MKKKYYLTAFLILLTALSLTKFWEFSMMAMIVFCLAYLTKGSRKTKS